MLPLRGKIPHLHRPELLLAKNLFSSLSPSAGAGGAKEPGHLRCRHLDVEPDSSGSELPAEAGLDGYLGEQLHDDDEEEWEELPCLAVFNNLIILTIMN